MAQTNIVWDANKRLQNIKDHDVDFVDIDDTFFMDYDAITVPDRRHDEPRWVSIATNGFGAILFVCYAYEENGDIALISARHVDASERKAYQEKR
ncbi:BrnT family toxin [Paraburkholderia sp. Ac-20340]|uniref:BrnT family toxin n=1 Tax=Paraburkholderia sp. Ac-20340 TaxID=2703888 RepID=UPI00197FC9D8|nr:BrnT family toxin [Paraburkholderia sp. Ac-20340]MBN3858420.1 BrnT family toxin [Paraburkholderia sp. Ac-20340]